MLINLVIKFKFKINFAIIKHLENQGRLFVSYVHPTSTLLIYSFSMRFYNFEIPLFYVVLINSGQNFIKYVI